MDNRFSKQKGIAAVEMLLVLPVLLIILVGIVELSRIFIHYTTLNKTVQAGARYALVDIYGAQPNGSLAPETQIKNIVVYGTRATSGNSKTVLSGLSTSDVSVTSDTQHITVSAVYAYTPIFSKIPFTNTSLSMNLTASASMRRAGS